MQALALLLQSEQDLPSCSTALRARVAGSSRAAEIDDVIAALLVSRFSGRAEQDNLIRNLPLERLEALAEALLDFQGMADLNAWLAANA